MTAWLMTASGGTRASVIALRSRFPDARGWSSRLHPSRLSGHELGRARGLSCAPILGKFFTQGSGITRSGKVQGDEIPLAARIVACLHAMTSDRSYRPAMPLAVAVAEMKAGAGSQFDPAVVTALRCTCIPRDEP